MADDVGVRGEVVAVVDGAAGPGFAEGGGKELGTDPAVAVHSARPSRSRTPWTMPGPRNQW